MSKDNSRTWRQMDNRAAIIAQDKKFVPRGQPREVLEEAKKRPEDRLLNLECAQYREKFERLAAEDV
jgi:hypothetical protein